MPLGWGWPMVRLLAQSWPSFGNVISHIVDTACASLGPELEVRLSTPPWIQVVPVSKPQCQPIGVGHRLPGKLERSEQLDPPFDLSRVSWSLRAWPPRTRSGLMRSRN